MRENASSCDAGKVARGLSRALGVAAYNSRSLVRAGLIRLIGARHVRGAVEHLHALIPKDQTAPAPFVDYIMRMVDACGASTRPALNGGPARAAVLDSLAREQLGALLAALRPKVERIVDQSTDRAGG